MNKYVKSIGLTSGVALFTLILSNQAAISAGCIEGSCTGYTKTAAQCQGKDAIRCPFDTSKYFCANDTCTEEQEWCEASQSCTPTCNGYIQMASDSDIVVSKAANLLPNAPIEAICFVGQTLEYCYNCAGTKYYKCIGENTNCSSGYAWCEAQGKCVSTCDGYTKIETGVLSSCLTNLTKLTCTDCNGDEYFKCSGGDSSDSSNSSENSGGGSSGDTGTTHPCTSQTSCWDYCKCLKDAGMLGEGQDSFMSNSGGQLVNDMIVDCTCSADGKPM